MPKPRPLQPREPPLGSPGREELGGVARALPRAERPPERRLRWVLQDSLLSYGGEGGLGS